MVRVREVHTRRRTREAAQRHKFQVFVIVATSLLSGRVLRTFPQSQFDANRKFHPAERMLIECLFYLTHY